MAKLDANLVRSQLHLFSTLTEGLITLLPDNMEPTVKKVHNLLGQPWFADLVVYCVNEFGNRTPSEKEVAQAVTYFGKHLTQNKETPVE